MASIGTRTAVKKILLYAYTDIESFFDRFPKYSILYRGNETIVALGQGSALHYIDNKNGIIKNVK